MQYSLSEAATIIFLPGFIHGDVIGLLIEIGNAQETTFSPERFISNEELHSSLVEKALKKVRREYDWKNSTQAMATHYHACISGRVAIS